MTSLPHNEGGETKSGDELCETSGMMMYFHTGHCETVLFEGWKITSDGELIGSIFGIFCLAALYEGLRYLRDYLARQDYNNTIRRKSNSEYITSNNETVHNMFSRTHALQTLLHAIQIILSYFLMLIFMTFNLWLCLAIIFGAAIGYFLLGWRKLPLLEIQEHSN